MSDQKDDKHLPKITSMEQFNNLLDNCCPHCRYQRAKTIEAVLKIVDETTYKERLRIGKISEIPLYEKEAIITAFIKFKDELRREICKGEGDFTC